MPLYLLVNVKYGVITTIKRMRCIMRYAVISVILLVSAVYADTFFISEGNLDDPSFEEELVSGQFPDWTFSGSGSFVR